MTHATLLSIFTFLLILQSISTIALSSFNLKSLQANTSNMSSSLSNVTILQVDYLIDQDLLDEILKTEMVDLWSLSFSNEQHVNEQLLTARLIKTIFQGQLLGQMRWLDLSFCNINDEMMMAIDVSSGVNKTLLLQGIVLDNNYMSQQALSRLAEFKYPNLKHFSIRNNLLITKIAIDHLINIITDSTSGIQSLDISYCNINRQNMIYLLKHLNTTHLKHLEMGGSTLHQESKYEQPNNYSFYEWLASTQMDNLQTLHLNDVSLQSEVILLLTNWTLPGLKELNLSNNFIRDEYIAEWITKDNMPQLSRLHLQYNAITDHTLQHILNQHFQLEQLIIAHNPIHFTHLTAPSKFYQLKELHFILSQVQSQQIKAFTQHLDVKFIEYINIFDCSYLQDLFQILPYKNYERLQRLFIEQDSHFMKSLSYFITLNDTIFPRLKILKLNYIYQTHEISQDLINHVQTLFPMLERLEIREQYFTAINFTKLHLQPAGKQPLIVSLAAVTFEILGDTMRIIGLYSMWMIVLMSTVFDVSAIFQLPTTYIAFPIPPNANIPQILALSLAKQLSQTFQLTKLEQLKIERHAQVMILLEWLQLQDIRLMYVQTLDITVAVEFQLILKLLNRIDISTVTNLNINIILKEDIVTANHLLQANFEQLGEQLKKCSLLTRLSLKFSNTRAIKMYNSYIAKLFNSFHFPYLQHFNIPKNNMQLDDIKPFLRAHSTTLRRLNFQLNFKASKSQDHFFAMLKDNKLTLEWLDLSYITLSVEDCHQLGQLQLNFMKRLTLNRCDLTDQHIQALTTVNRSKSFIFQKLLNIELLQNNIRQQGLVQLFQQSLYSLKVFQIQNNFLPNLINIALSYTTKLIKLQAYRNQLYTIDHQLNRLSTRRLQVVYIQSSEFDVEDFRLMASFSLQNLVSAAWRLRDKYDCQVLEHVLRSWEHAHYVWLNINNEFPGLNSKCLRGKEQKDYKHQFKSISIYDEGVNTYLPEFITILLRSKSHLLRLAISNLRLPPQLFKNINHRKLDYLTHLYLSNNYIDDEGFINILQSPLHNLRHLDISQTELTSQSLKYLENRSFPSLQVLRLEGLALGDYVFQLLGSLEVHNLRELYLSNCGIISLKGFRELNILKITVLMISSNFFTIEDFLEFLDFLETGRWKMIQFILVYNLHINTQQDLQIETFQQKTKIQIQRDKAHKISLINNAKY